MKIIRWKSRYLTGNVSIDQKNRKTVECLNGFIQATKQNEHCQDIEIFLEELAGTLETLLEENPSDTQLTEKIKNPFNERLPLPTRETAACKKCGICDILEKKIAPHFKTSAKCLGMSDHEES